MVEMTSHARGFLGALALVGVLSGSVWHAPDARSKAVGSRGDPLFYIAGTSGGTAVNFGIQIGVSVSAAASQVTGVTYALHGPVGTAVKLEFATDDVLASKESYTYTGDRTDLKVVETTTVTTTKGSVPVTLSASAFGYTGTLAVTAPFQVAGMSNQPITVTLIGG